MSLERNHIIYSKFRQSLGLKSLSLAAVSLFSLSEGLSTNNDVSAPTIIASTGVQNSSFILEPTDGKVAAFHDFNDVLVLDLGKTVKKGESYSVVWKKASSLSNETLSHLQIRESASTSNFILNPVSPTSLNSGFITSRFTAHADIRYVMISTASPVEDAIDVDGIYLDSNDIKENKIHKITSESSIQTENDSETVKPSDEESKTEDFEENSDLDLEYFNQVQWNNANLNNETLFYCEMGVATRKKFNWVCLHNYVSFKFTRQNLYEHLSNSGDPPEQNSRSVLKYNRTEIRPPPS